MVAEGPNQPLPDRPEADDPEPNALHPGSGLLTGGCDVGIAPVGSGARELIDLRRQHEVVSRKAGGGVGRELE